MVKYAEAQVASRETGLMGQSQGFDDCIKNEFVKGENAGIRLFVQIPSVVERDFTEQIDEINEVIKNG